MQEVKQQNREAIKKPACAGFLLTAERAKR
jgi:hypothetical protein